MVAVSYSSYTGLVLSGLLYASKQEINYKSRLTFALDEGDQNGIGNFLNLASQFGINVGSGKDIFAGDNIIDIMKSRRMIERVFFPWTLSTIDHIRSLNIFWIKQ